MHSALGAYAPVAQVPHFARNRTYVPPCAPSTSGRVGSRLVVRAGKDGSEKKEKADFSARWALRIKNFFSSRRKYLEEAEHGGDEEAERAAAAELAREQEELQKQRMDYMEAREAEFRQQEGAGDMSESLVAGDVARARLDLQHSPLTHAVLAVVRARELLRALLLLPLSLAGWAVQSWQGLFATQRYENFLMSEGERIWFWRNRTENERWFWEIFVWDRLLFPTLTVVCYEYLVPNHFLWSVVAPFALMSWLSGRLTTPDTAEFWMLAYFGFYRKAWPDIAAWLTGHVMPMLAF